MAAGVVGELDVPDLRQVALQRPRQVALHHLGVVDVVLQAQVGAPAAAISARAGAVRSR
jgi:hypothetical protein